MPELSFKGFTAPVWILGITAVLKSFAIIVTIIAVKLYTARQAVQPLTVSWLPDAAIVVLLIAQAFTYWFLRNKIYSRTWVKLHVWLTVFVLLVLPLLVTLLYTSPLKVDSYKQVFTLVNRLRLYLFWSLLMMANVFFVATVIKSYKGTDESFCDEIDAIGKDG